MSTNRIQKLLFSEYCDFEDMVLVESPFAQTTREGRGIRQVSLGLTPTKLVLATDVLPLAQESSVCYIPGIDPEIETFELVAVYPVECLSLSIFHRRNRQSIKAHFCNNKILYFELGGFEKRQMFWNLWCERVKFLSPEDPGSSHSETSVATSTSNSTLYLLATKRIFNNQGIPQVWCKFGTESQQEPPKWTDRHLYLGKNIEESPLNYSPAYLAPSISQFVGNRSRNLTKSKFSIPSSQLVASSSRESHVHRFARGVPEGCSSGLFLKESSVTHRNIIKPCVKEVKCFAIPNIPTVPYRELSENAVKTWENASSGLENRGRHKRRYGIAPQPHFMNGLGPWSVPPGDRFSIQIKRAVSMVSIRRQPLEPELRLPVSKRQLVASVSCEALHLDNRLQNNSNTIKTSLKRPVVFFWTPEYWYRPRSARDAYHELLNHLKKVRQYCQSTGKLGHKGTKKRLFKRERRSRLLLSDSDDQTNHKLRKYKQCYQIFSPLQEAYDDSSDKERTRKPEETSLDYLRRILKVDIALTAWDFDSTTLACQLTLIDRDLFLKIPSIELGVLLCQQTSKNAPNIGAFEAFSHRISCLVATEVIRNDSEKIRARLIARLINTAEKCHKISNFQSCRSILCGLQSPSVYRLHLTWSYVRKRHATKYQAFENLCRLYRDPKLPAYQKTFQRASEERPFLPSLSDIITRLLSKIPMLDIKPSNVSHIAKGQIITMSSTTLTQKSSAKQSANHGALKKILSTLKILPINNKEIECISEQVLNNQNWYDDNRIFRLNKAIEFLETSQRAASAYALRKNDLARDFLLKARYREEQENFMNSFSDEKETCSRRCTF